jgi:hypothetical protein
MIDSFFQFHIFRPASHCILSQKKKKSELEALIEETKQEKEREQEQVGLTPPPPFPLTPFLYSLFLPDLTLSFFDPPLPLLSLSLAIPLPSAYSCHSFTYVWASTIYPHSDLPIYLLLIYLLFSFFGRSG